MQHPLSRRRVIAALGVCAGAVATLPLRSASATLATLPAVSKHRAPAELARDEDYWREIATYYDRVQDVLNLEHGYWGKMARPVKDAYMAATTMANTRNSLFGRKEYAALERESVRRIARALGAGEDEIVLTRNATEAVHNLIRQYRGLRRGDAVLYADVDYPQFKKLMHWLQASRGVHAATIELPPRASRQQIIDRYLRAMDANPTLRLMLLTHVSNQHGLVIPVAEITAEARRRGVDVICDSAQSWGLLDYRIGDLGVDWAGFNLHKWIGSPVGVGALYMRRGSLEKIAPYPGESDPDNSRAATRIHMGTANFAAMISVPAALDFHEAVGGAHKEARLRYLRGLWTAEAGQMSHIELLGGADEASWTGIGAFRLRGRTSPEDAAALQRRLEEDFGIFTVVRRGLASGNCIRITPQVFTSPEEIGRLVSAMHDLRSRA